jgi:hypothetical protein
MIEDSKDKKGFNYENLLGLGYSLNQNIKITSPPLAPGSKLPNCYKLEAQIAAPISPT